MDAEGSVPRRKKIASRKAEQDDAAAQLAKAVGPPRTKRPPSKGITLRGIKRAQSEVQEFLNGRGWSDAKPHHLVALYALCHAETYGVEVINELVGNVWFGARSAATKMLRDEFDDDLERGVEFLRWTWHREGGRETWRRQHGKPGGRITWRTQFQLRALINEYRIELERQRGR